MANKRLWLGMLIMVLTFRMTVVSCDDGSTDNGADSSLNGRWVFSPEDGIEAVYTFNNGNFETSVNDSPSTRGTYTTRLSNITITSSHFYGTDYGLDPKWYPISELEAVYRDMGIPAEIIAEATSQQTGTYAVRGNTLTMTYRDETTTLTRKN